MKTKHPGLVELGKNVRYYRRINKLSQEQLGFHCKVDRGYLSEVECGKRMAGPLVLMRIAKTLNIQVGDLFPDVREITL